MKHAVITVLFLLASQLATCAQEYKIQLSVPSKVGDKFQLRATGGETNQFNVTQNGGVLQRRATLQTWDLDAEVAITGVSAKGQANQLNIKITKFTATKDGQARSLPANTAILASVKGNEKHFTIGGKPADADLNKMLKRIFELDKGGATNDESFGTKEPKKVGDQWKANSQLMAKDAKREGLTIKPGDISATATLTKVGPVDGKNCLHVVVKGDIKNIAPPIPEDLRVKEAGMKLKISAAIPVDFSTPELALTEEMNMRMVMESTRQPGVMIESTSVSTVRSQFTRHPRR